MSGIMIQSHAKNEKNKKTKKEKWTQKIICFNLTSDAAATVHIPLSHRHIHTPTHIQESKQDECPTQKAIKNLINFKYMCNFQFECLWKGVNKHNLFIKRKSFLNVKGQVNETRQRILVHLSTYSDLDMKH